MSARIVPSHAGSCALIPDDQRTEMRRIVNLSAFAREAGSTILHVTISDLTTNGCRLTSVIDLEPATALWLKIPGLTPRRAVIRWAEGREAGCEFDAAISEETLAEAAAAAERTAVQLRQRLKGHFG